MQITSSILNEREAARILGLSVHTLRARRFKGQAPAYLKLGKSVRYEREALERFLESCRVRVGGEAA
ncbi:MAG: helix-turn-helix transcriptional regulator [Pseudodesulfovibrio sp.]|uniref:helix-turn-helix transcriptional regulator n=1 Tax=Pseudodesulfovibrio sp. TaxID=2035812 RepID=UPI003D0C1113